MNPETSVSNDQIVSIFRRLKLAHNPTIRRINIGFTNEVHQVDDYILKIYIRKDGHNNFVKEAKLYKALYPKVLVPKWIASDDSKKVIDKPYTIYQKIEGDPLGRRWHQ